MPSDGGTEQVPVAERSDEYVEGYLDALDDVADGCYETAAEIKQGNDFEDGDERCSQCGAELVKEMGSEEPLCPNCTND